MWEGKAAQKKYIQGASREVDPASRLGSPYPSYHIGIRLAGLQSVCPGPGRDSNSHCPALENGPGSPELHTKGPDPATLKQNPASSTSSRSKGGGVVFVFSFSFLSFTFHIQSLLFHFSLIFPFSLLFHNLSF